MARLLLGRPIGGSACRAYGQSGLRIGRLSLRGVLCSTKTTLTPTVSATTGGKNAGHPRWYAGIKKVPANGGPVVGVAGQRLTWKARGEDTAYIFSTYEMTLFPEKAVALHYHPYAEVFYVLDGEVEFGSMKDGREEWIPCLAGETVIAGPDVVHGFRNSSGKPARFLSISTQLHQAFFDECAVTAKRDDPIPPFPDGEELQRLLEGAAKHQIYLFEQE